VPFLQIGRRFSLDSTILTTSDEIRVLVRVMSDTPEWSQRTLLYVPGSHYLASYEAAGEVFVLGRWIPYTVDPEIDPAHPDAPLPFDVNLLLHRKTTYVAPTPLPPGGLAAKKDASNITLEWTAPLYNEDGSRIRNLAGYYVYRSTSSGTGFVRLNELPLRSNAFTDFGVTEPLHYVVTAVNTDAIESRLSEELSIEAPSSPAGGGDVVSTNPIRWDRNAPWLLLAIAVSYAVLSLIDRVPGRRD
jgi:hypothetical protein